MAGISSKAAGMVENKKKYQEYEFNTDFDINLYESFYRSHDPQLGRFLQIDPKPNDMESPYVAMGNNPTQHTDFLGYCYTDINRKSNGMGDVEKINPLAPFTWYGPTSIQADNVRTNYNTEAAKLSPTDKQSRADLKETTRAKTPEPFKTAVEKSRPMEGERAKVKDPNFKGNATKTNVDVNNTAKNIGRLGKVFTAGAVVQSAITIANSPTPVKESLTEGAGWYGAYTVGGQFAAATPGGPAPKLISGFIGGIVGFTLGKNAGDAILNAGPIIKDALQTYNTDHPIEKPGNLIYHICFEKGTLIYTQESEVPIENVMVGDVVYSYNIELNKVENSKVFSLE